MSDWSNDFEIAIGAVFDKASEQRAISDFLQFAARVEREGIGSSKRQVGDAQKAAAKRLSDQSAANRKWSEGEKQHARAMMLVMREFFRERAQAEREAKQTERREFERQAKQDLSDRKAANQRLQAVVAAGLKDAQDRRKSAQKIREQDNASGLRRFENQEKEAARNLERLAKQQAAEQTRQAKEVARNLERLAREQTAEQVRLAKEAARNLERVAKEQAAEQMRLAKEAARESERVAKQAARDAERIDKERVATAARLDKERIANSTAAAKEEAAIARREGERLAQQQRQNDRLVFNAEQESSARRIARAKALYSTLTTIARTGAQATQNVVTSFFRRRENAAKQSGDRITNIDRSTTTKSTSVIRQQLDAQNREYSTAAQKRLRIIETNADRERRVITANAVKQAEAQTAIQQRTSTGLIGAAAGRSAAGGGLQSLLYGAAGLYGIKKLIDASSSLAESQSKVGVVFGSSAAMIRDFASTSAKAIGESEQATLEALGTYGNLFQSFGVGRKLAAEYSVGLVKLASDLASFNNTSVQDAIEALRSGLTGETEPLKRYGIAINETLLKQEAARLGLVKSSVSQTELTRNTIAAEKAQKAAATAASKYGANSIQAREAMAKYDAVVEKVGKSLKGKLPAQLDSAQKAQAAYSLIMQRSTLAQGDFNRTQEGFANQSRIVTARLKDLQAAAGNGLLPIALALAYTFNKAILPALEKSTEAVSDFIKKIATGEGVWKVVRDGLTGIAVGLGAILAVKAGVEVVGLLAAGLKLLGGAVVAAPVVAALVALGAVGYTLYRNAPGIRSFFDSLVEGTKNWYLVGYRISEPIENLSKIVLLQSTFGAAARVIVDGLKGIGRGVEDFRNGLGTGALEEAARQSLRGLGDVLAPARDVVADGLQVIFERGRDFLATRALPILGEARLNVGSFLLPLLGLTGGDGGVVSRLVTSAITKLFLGSIASFNPDLPAAQLGAKGREIIDRALAIARQSATNVQAFFGSLFGGEVDFDSFASTLGGQLNETISGAFSRLKERLGPINDLLAAIGGAVASGFMTYVLPRLIELPRIVGRFISKTVFSEEFLKAISIGAAAIAGTALIVAGQFVRGFIEGLIERRGDIAKTVLDILGFTVKTILGSGNPFIILGGALVAAFAGAKVLGAIGTLRGQFRIAAAGMTGDAGKLQQAVADAARAKRPASTSKVGNAALAISDGYRKAETVVRRIGATIENAGAKTIKLGGLIDGVGSRLLKLPLDATTNAAGRVVSGTTGRFVKDTTTGLNRLQRGAGEFANKYANLLSTPLVQAGAAIQAFPRTVESGLQKAGGYVSAFAGRLNKEIPTGADKAQAAMQVAGGAISGYMTAMAETGQAQAVGLVSSLGNIALAYGTAGPIVGTITAAATAIGFFWGESTKASANAEAEQKRIAADLAANAKEIQGAYKSAFDELGSTGAAARGVATLKVVQDQLGKNSKGIEDFARKFGGSWAGITEAARAGTGDLKRYTDELINSKITAIYQGNADAVRAFAAEAKAAATAGTGYIDGVVDAGLKSGNISQDQRRDLGLLAVDLRSGRISWDEYSTAVLDSGIKADDAASATERYVKALRDGLGSTAGGKVIANLATEMGKAVREQDLMEAAQQRVNRELGSTATIAERVQDAWGRVKEGIDRAREAYEAWIDATQGGRQTRNESITSILGAAREAGSERDPSWLGESDLERNARLENLAIEQARNAGGQLAQMWKDAGGNVDTFNANARAYFDELRNAAPNQEAKDFISQVQYLSTSPQQISLIVNAAPAVKSMEDIKTKLTDFISLPGNEKYAIDVSTTEGTKQAETLGSKLAELYNTDATVKAYIDTNFPGGFAEAYTSIVADTGFLSQITATAKANLGGDWKGQVALLTSGLDELERRETTLRVTPKLYDPTGGWTKLFGFLGIDLSFGSGNPNSIGAAPPGFNNAERQNRWGGVTAFAAGGITQAHIQRRQRIKYAEPETGGEAYVPRRGNRARSEAITHQIASWLGGKFIPGPRLRSTTAMADGGIITGGPSRFQESLGSITYFRATEQRIEDRIADIMARIERIMARVSKSMSLAEARAAVLEVTAAQHELGGEAGARWDEALTRFFASGAQRALPANAPSVGQTPSMVASVTAPPLPVPTRALPAASSGVPSQAQVVINRNLHVENRIDGTRSSTATALEVVRKARDSDFLAGGRSIEMEFVAS